jgi:hypothetical protein
LNKQCALGSWDGGSKERRKDKERKKENQQESTVTKQKQIQTT